MPPPLSPTLLLSSRKWETLNSLFHWAFIISRPYKLGWEIFRHFPETDGVYKLSTAHLILKVLKIFPARLLLDLLAFRWALFCSVCVCVCISILILSLWLLVYSLLGFFGIRDSELSESRCWSKFYNPLARTFGSRIFFSIFSVRTFLSSSQCLDL